ncbi:MAG: ornithine carbamoyltransferase [Planctomycetaceae bacterium]|jgi:ornithine carbamoyltransferase|nr:ornithine carbamoyltransferase [Planctomycetaceae bacterium]
MRHLLSLKDTTSKELSHILDLALSIKSDVKKGIRKPLLAGRTLALIFEKQSLRTRVSFEAGMGQLGGTTLFLGADVGFGKREPMNDFSRVLTSMVDAVAIRAMKHETAVELAKYATCPIINALTDCSHPCQAIADVLTIKEHFGKLQGIKLAYIGDANNVTVSLIQAAALLGMSVKVAAPKAYQFNSKKLSEIMPEKQLSSFSVEQTTDPAEAAKDADVIYTDVWVSMGQEKEEAKRKKDLKDYQVNAKLMRAAKSKAIFLHCLPARRGLEVTEDVIDSPKNQIIPQAENRLHGQKALLVWLLS